MAKVTLHAGSWGKGTAHFMFGSFGMPSSGWKTDSVPGNRLKSVEIATEESVKRVGGTVGWGVAGGVLLGPVGLLAGLLLGGRGKEVTFVAEFKDGKRILATTDAKTFKAIQALVF